MMQLNPISGKHYGFFLGLGIFILMLILPTPEGMAPAAWKVAATTSLMATWWITEAIPIPATALLPIFLYPLLGIMGAKDACASYADDVIYLFMGGFFLAVTMERWNLHRRLALRTIMLVGSSPAKLVLGFMIATAFLSMWVSNSATAMMMVPIGLAVVSEVTDLSTEQIRHGSVGAAQSDLNFGRSLMLGIAYAASIGGMATIIGTPPNAILVGAVKRLYGYEITFSQWLSFGVPFASIMLLLAWLILIKILFPSKTFKKGDAASLIANEYKELGPMSRPEIYVLLIGATMATLWILRGLVLKNVPALAMVGDSTIAIGGAMLLFACPVDFRNHTFLLDWKTAVQIPWDVVLLFGGGLAIAAGFQQTGLTGYIAHAFDNLHGMHVYLLLTLVVMVTGCVTEMTSNTATANLFVPIMGAVALALGLNPLGVMIATGIAASCAFMLPVATPPNAVAYGSGCFRIKDMAKAGVWMNVVSIIIVPLLVYIILPVFWGEPLNVVPDWAKHTL